MPILDINNSIVTSDNVHFWYLKIGRVISDINNSILELYFWYGKLEFKKLVRNELLI